MAASSSILHILKNGETVRSLKVESEAMIGRAEGCAVRLEDRAISRQHAVFRVISGGLQVERKSDYGQLLLNGADCSQALLKDGDVLTVGPYLVRVQIQKDVQPAAVHASAPEAVNEAHEPEAAVEVAEGDSPTPEEFSESPVEVQSESVPESSAGDESDFADPDSDGGTKFTPAVGVTVKLIFTPGSANVEELELTQDEISIGRGSSCNVILNDKKSSRKHAIIRRSGLSFVIKDLGSANGTFVNGIKVEEQELSGDDSISIGDVSFQFQALSSDYINQQNDFLRVEEQQDADTGGLDLDAAGAMALDVPNDEHAMASIPTEGAPGGTLSGIPGLAAHGSFGKEKKGFIQNLKNWKTLPPKQKIIVGVIAAALAYFIFIDDEDEHEIQIDPKQKVAAKQGGKRVPASFAMLTLDQKRYIDAQYNLAFDHFQNKDFDKSIYEIQKIFVLVEDYKNARELERYSKDGKRKVEAIEEEKKRKAREDQLKARILALVDETRELMKKKEYAPARELFAQILSIDPDNKDVVVWKNDIRAWEDQKAVEEQTQRIAASTNQRANEFLDTGLGLRKAGKCHDAIDLYLQAQAMKPSDEELAKKIVNSISDCNRLIAKLRNPVLRAAKKAEAGKSYARAYKLYERVSKIDPPNPAGPAGMARVRGRLHEIAKTAFAEAVVAEGYSDLTRARKLYEEIVKTAPHDDSYYQHAIRRLSRYGVLDRDDVERAAAQAAAAAAAQAANPDPSNPGAAPGVPGAMPPADALGAAPPSTETARAPAADGSTPDAPAGDGVPDAPNLGGG